jgi:hypothetical protein
MGTLLIFLLAGCLAHAYQPTPLPYRNTVFGDEQLEGGPFEFINALNGISVNRNVDNPYRLPTTTRPKHYNVHLSLNMTALTFSGEVDIQLYATQANVNEIVIHAHDMTITSLNLQQGNRTIFHTHTRQPEYHFLRVRLTSESLAYNSLLEDQQLYNLKITFESIIRRDMTGLYRNWFKNNPNETER